MMKVFNLTDVETPKLKQHGLLNQTVVVGGKPIAPGASMTFEGTPSERASAKHAAKVGAVSVDALPGAYTTAKASSASPMPKAPAPAPAADPTPMSKRPKGA